MNWKNEISYFFTQDLPGYKAGFAKEFFEIQALENF